MSTTESAQPAFEALLARLQEIVKLMEQDSLPLDQSIRLYEEGLELTRQCSLRIEDARLRIEKIDARGSA